MTGEERPAKKVTPLNVALSLALIVAVQLVSLGITYQNRPVYQAVGPINIGPFPSTTSGSAGNAFVLVGLVFATTLVLVFLIRKRLINTFKLFVFGSISISAFSLTWLTVDGALSSFSWYGSFPYLVEVEVALALLPVAAIGYIVFVRNVTVLSLVVLGFISAEVGSFFASTLPPTSGLPLTAVLLALIFALYDVYAVFKGPLKSLINTAPPGVLAAMAVRAGEFTIGLGDLVFYSMIPSIAMYYLQPIYSAYALVAVDFGVVATLYLLTKKRLLPGLPIPMFLGVLVLSLLFRFG